MSKPEENGKHYYENKGLNLDDVKMEVHPENKHGESVAANGGNTAAPPSGLDKELTEEQIKCGYGKCKPSGLQSCNNSKTVLAVLCWFGVIQGFVVNGVNNVNTSSIERRFNLASSQVGWVSSSYDFSAGLTVIFVGYFGRNGHMPRYLAMASFMIGLGSMIMCLPHFITGTYSLGNEEPISCSATASNCESDSYLPNFLYVLITGQVLNGIGGTTLYTVGIVWLDENVPGKWSAMYIGIFEAMAAVGPALGFLVGGMFLDIYVDADVINTDTLTIDSGDPRWVGAWWIGFIISAILCLTATMMFLCFGRETPGAKLVRAERVNQAHVDKKTAKWLNKDGFGEKLKDLPKVTWILLKNPTFLFTSLAGASTLLVAAGFATFLAKFIQNQFNQTSKWGALLAGFIIVPGAAGGQIIGGIICSKFRLKVRGMLNLCAIAQFIAVVAMAIFFAFCSPPNMAGINMEYGSTSTSMTSVNLTASCNTGCGCNTDVWEPICGIDKIEYFSPCHAGCRAVDTQPTHQYWNCSCIEANIALVNNSETMATHGTCAGDCWVLPLFLGILFIVILGTMATLTPSLAVTLRCIPDCTRTFALGVQWVFLRFLGSIPGPLLFGAVIDRNCLVWKQECDKTNSSCWVYDKQAMSTSMFGLGLACGLVTLVCFLIARFTYKRPKGDECTPTGGSTENIADSKTDISKGISNPALDITDDVQSEYM